MNQQFPKAEKLKRDKIIEQLFKNGNNVKAFPLVLVYLETELSENVAIQAGFSVPKRNHKSAVLRNRLKRLMRESYRKNKTEFRVGEFTYAFMFIYVGKEIVSYAQINDQLGKIITKFNAKTEDNKYIATSKSEA
ncbi:MAG TPA: ribonuclease P protein component [Leeuwenhoekiella sp.]|nr:ribonuclease P protein component [Leeuwenhoekiella sp.]